MSGHNSELQTHLPEIELAEPTCHLERTLRVCSNRTTLGLIPMFLNDRKFIYCGLKSEVFYLGYISHN